MMMMSVLLCHFPEILGADLLIFRSDLCFGPFKDLACLDPGIRIFHILSILHHFLNIILYPLLFGICISRTHIAEKLLAGEVSYLVGLHMDSIVVYNPV